MLWRRAIWECDVPASGVEVDARQCSRPCDGVSILTLFPSDRNLASNRSGDGLGLSPVLRSCST